MYYIIIIQNKQTPAIFGYENYDAALSRFHTEMAYRAEGRTSTMCMIINDSGSVYKQETWSENPYSGA